MKCYHPINIGGDENPFYVPCGRCLACQERKQSEWSLRLTHELQYSKSAHFVTLTYNDEHLQYFNELTGEETDLPSVSLRHIQLFFKRLRKALCKEFGREYRIRYYLASEYGPTYHRPHYHAIIYGLPVKNAREYVDSAWQNGFVQVDSVTGARIRYVTKYCMKDHGETGSPDPKVMPVFSTMSRRPFIGHDFVFQKSNMLKYMDNPETTQYLTLNGFKYAFPKAYLRVYCPEKSATREWRAWLIECRIHDKEMAKRARLKWLYENDIELYRYEVWKESQEEREHKARKAREELRKKQYPLKRHSIQTS